MLGNEGDRTNKKARAFRSRFVDFFLGRRTNPFQRANARLIAGAHVPIGGQQLTHGGDALFDLPLIRIATVDDTLREAMRGEEQARRGR